MKLNYDALRAKLLEDGRDQQSYSFAYIERIIGGNIPNDYINRKTFKQRSVSRFQQYALKAGFEIVDADYDRRMLTFQRSSTIQQAVRHVSLRQYHAVQLGVSANTLNPNDIGKDLDTAIAYFKRNWTSTGPSQQWVPFCDKYRTIDEVYYHAGDEAYRASVKNRWSLFGDRIGQRERENLREASVRYLAQQFSVLFQKDEMNFDIFSAWAYETATQIRQIYRNGGVDLYNYGHAQKIINVALKFVLSSNLVDYHNEVFRYCHFPVDGRIQAIIKSELGVHLLKQNGVQRYADSSWSKNDNWSDFIDYQTRVREAVLRYGYYSPLIWEATHWH